MKRKFSILLVSWYGADWISFEFGGDCLDF